MAATRQRLGVAIRDRAEPPSTRRTAPGQLDLAEAAQLPAGDVLQELGSNHDRLSSLEVDRRLNEVGPNAVRSHSVRAIAVFVSQLRSPFLLLLLGTGLAFMFFARRRTR